MDRLTAWVTLNHGRLRIERIARHRLLERLPDMATPKLQGLASAMAMLEHNLEAEAGKLATKIEALGSRGLAAIAKGHTKVDGIAGRVDEVETFVSALEGANGGDPLESSSNASAPQAEGAGQFITSQTGKSI